MLEVGTSERDALALTFKYPALKRGTAGLESGWQFRFLVLARDLCATRLLRRIQGTYYRLDKVTQGLNKTAGQEVSATYPP